MADKYSADDLKDSLKKGHALKNANGDPSYPIEDQDDLQKAIKAVGRGGADHDAIRAHIIAQAKRLGLSKLIPDNWNADGSLSQANDAELEDEETTDEAEDNEERADCPTCKGKGTIMAGNRKCPDCNGTGNAPESKSAAWEMAEFTHINRKKPRHRTTLPAAREFRRFAAEGLEVRSDNGSDGIEVTGTPIVYNTPYTVTDAFGQFEETMAPGVATNVLSGKPDVRFLFNHDGLPLARSASGTLSMKDTDAGLTFSATLDSRQQLASDLAVAIERGDVNQMSCGFIVANDTWDADMVNRTIYRFQDLLDISAVTYPASPTTSISVAERMMMDAPVESRARVRRMWAISKELRNGREITPETAGVLMDGLRVLATADEMVEEALEPEEERTAPEPEEERAAPTKQDAVVSKAITTAHQATGAALAAQAKDPDNNSDKDDKDVIKHLTDAHNALTKAVGAQAKDAAPDAVTSGAQDDGTQDSPGSSGSDTGDNTGREDETPVTKRNASALRLELDVLGLKYRRR